MSLLGSPDVDRLKARQDIHGLIRALGTQDDNVRRRAADALAEIGAPAVQPLIAALKSKNQDKYGRGCPVEALGCSGDRRAVDALSAALIDDEGWMQKAAIRALKQLEQQPEK